MIAITNTLDVSLHQQDLKIQVSDRDSSPPPIKSFFLEFSDDSQPEEKAKDASQGEIIHGEDNSPFDTSCPTMATSSDILCHEPFSVTTRQFLAITGSLEKKMSSFEKTDHLLSFIPFQTQSFDDDDSIDGKDVESSCQRENLPFNVNRIRRNEEIFA